MARGRRWSTEATASLPSRRGRPGPNRSEQNATASASSAPAWSAIAAAITGSSAGSAIILMADQECTGPAEWAEGADAGSGRDPRHRHRRSSRAARPLSISAMPLGAASGA